MDSDRTAYVTLVSETHKAQGIDLTRRVSLLQTRFLFDISATTTSIPAYSTSRYRLNIECSADWSVTKCPAWLTPASTSGTGDSVLDFSITPNTSKTSTLSGTITIKSLYNNVEKSISVTQDAFSFNVDRTGISGLSPVGASQCEINVTGTAEAPWSVTSSTEWVTIVSGASGAGNGSVVLNVKDNPATASRTGSVVLTNSISGESKTVSITQNAYEFRSTASYSYKYSELATSSNSFSLTCSGSWTVVVSDGSWLHISSLSGTGNSSISFYPDKNTTLYSRSATVTVFSDLQRGTTQELKTSFTVTQDAFKFDSSSESKSFDALNDDSKQSLGVYVTCSGSWTLEDVPSWIKISPSSGSGNGSILIVPQTNSTTSERNATFYVVSSDNTALRKQITVTQKAYVFNVDSSTASVSSAQSTVSVKLSASSSWTASSGATWVTLDPASGSGDATVTLTVGKNSGAARSTTVTFKSNHGPTATVTISQAKK